MGAAGVPPSQWAAQLQVLRAGAAGAAGSEERAAEEEEAAACLRQAAQLAAAVVERLEGGAGGLEAAQALLDASALCWPVPAGWVQWLDDGQRAQLLALLLQTHPPLSRRIEAVHRLAREAQTQL